MISCIIVAGGKSERMGMDKKFVRFNGKMLLEHAIDVARKVADEVIVVVGSKEQEKQVKKVTNLKIVVDEQPEKGPLMGILSGLRVCKSEYAVVMPTDTPFMKPEIFKKMLGEAKGSDAVIPQDGKYMVTLHAVYRAKAMLDAAEKTINARDYAPQSAARRLKKVKLIPLEEFRKYDKELLTFRSINTLEDLERFNT